MLPITFPASLNLSGVFTNTKDFTGKSAEEIKLISEYLKYMEYLAKWDGKLPVYGTTPNLFKDITK